MLNHNYKKKKTSRNYEVESHNSITGLVIMRHYVRTAGKSLLGCASDWADPQFVLVVPPLSCSQDHLCQSASNRIIQPLTFVSWLASSLRLCVKAVVRVKIAHATLQSKNESAGVTASCLSASSVLGITHSVSVDGKHGLGFWQAGRVIDFTDPCLSSAFPQVQTANTRPVLTNLEWWNRDVMTLSVSALLSPAVSSKDE